MVSPLPKKCRQTLPPALDGPFISYAPINVNPPGGGGGGGSGICGVFDHQLHPHPGDFDQHFGPKLGQFEPNDFY